MDTPLRAPIRMVLNSWVFGFNRFIFRDIVVNVAIYVPVGAVGYLAFRRHQWWKAWALAGPVLLGALLSVTVEVLQIFQALRTCSLVDVITKHCRCGIRRTAGDHSCA